MDASPTAYDPLTHRLGVLAVACAVPLVLFGGSVTTLGAGMAVEGWLIAEGHFLLLFPVESWLRDTGTFVEHTHRLFGVVVGLVAIAACAAAWRARRAGRRASLAAPSIALAAVCAQGALGGFRVLADSPDLAFLHGVFAQATFALLAIAAAVASRPWAAAPSARPWAAPLSAGARDAAAPFARLSRLAAIATAVVFVQVALGAWVRHGLRPDPVAASELRLALHFAGAAATFVAVALLAAAARGVAGSLAGPVDGATGQSVGRSLVSAVLARSARRLHALLGLQIVLGLCAWAGFRPGAIGPAEWALSILHVLVGALLLGQCAILVAWSRRLRGARAGVAAGRMALEAAR